MTPIALRATHVHPMIMFETRIALVQTLSNCEDAIHEISNRALLMDGEER
jgi:hypothetical protein